MRRDDGEAALNRPFHGRTRHGGQGQRVHGKKKPGQAARLSVNPFLRAADKPRTGLQGFLGRRGFALRVHQEREMLLPFSPGSQPVLDSFSSPACRSRRMRSVDR